MEIKHPKPENLFASLREGVLERSHEYYYQIQCQLLVSSFSYCDYFVYVDQENYYKERVNRDENCMEEIAKKGEVFFRNFALPELLAKCYSQDRIPILNDDPVCFCQRPRFHPLVICAGGDNCRFKFFHCRCVGLKSKPRTKWYCEDCQHLKKKPLSHKN